jgi:hypothetical protein
MNDRPMAMLRRLMSAFPSESQWSEDRREVWLHKLRGVYGRIPERIVDDVFRDTVAESRFAPTPAKFCGRCYDLHRDELPESRIEGGPDVDPNEVIQSPEPTRAFMRAIRAKRGEPWPVVEPELRSALEHARQYRAGDYSAETHAGRIPEGDPLPEFVIESRLQHMRNLWNSPD